MKTPDVLNAVAKFHQTFQHPVLPEPAIPSAERCSLRVRLIAEELEELEAGIANKNIIEIADALCDLQYVLSGTVLEFGLGKKFNDLFNEVQRSNMSKTCASKEEAEETATFYLEKKGTEATYKTSGGRWLVYRASDGKTLKSIRYSPPDLEQILLNSTSETVKDI